MRDGGQRDANQVCVGEVECLGVKTELLRCPVKLEEAGGASALREMPVCLEVMKGENAGQTREAAAIAPTLSHKCKLVWRRLFPGASDQNPTL